MTKMDQVDFFHDLELANDPYPWYEHLRAKGPAVPLARDVVAVVGYDEGLAIFRDEERYSAIDAVGGPFPPLPFTPDPSDMTTQIEEYRAQMAFGGIIMTEDPPQHNKSRALLMGMITPKRLKENEEFMWRLADQQMDKFIDSGRVEFLSEYGQPFATSTIADLLGVPPEDHYKFAELSMGTPAVIGKEMQDAEVDPFIRVGMHFAGYIAERRENPKNDILTEFAQAKYPDGSLPAIPETVATAIFLFSAGQHTTVRLFGAMLRYLTEDLELQKRLRAERNRIPDFIEEALRMDGAVKTDFRMNKVPVSVGGVDFAPGKHFMLLINAMNRDPQKFENPNQLNIDRRNNREHVAFGRGIHACAGAPLARAEARVTLERLFDRTKEFRLSEQHHGPAGARRFRYEPSYTLRGLSDIHLEFDKA